MHVLCLDAAPDAAAPEHMAYYTIADLALLPATATIMAKYSGSKDKVRWCLKPVFLQYLLRDKAEKVIYTDNDIYFYDDPAFLFVLLDDHNFLLTPHHYPHDPEKEQNWLEANFKVGLYNAGFVGVNRDAAASLQWWAACCIYRCEKNLLRGTFDDQKYLDLIPVMEESAYILRHRGCNVAEWNKAVIKRSDRNGRVILDDKYPLVFVHYNGTTVRAIEDGAEPVLKDSFDTYLQNLRRYKPDIKAGDLEDKPKMSDRLKYIIWELATRWGL